MNKRAALKQYGVSKISVVVGNASPHLQILMLLDGLLEKIAKAKGFMENQVIAEKGHNIGLAIAICNGLRACLNHEEASELATNLDALYDYIGRRLLQANLHNDPVILDEVAGLARTIKEAWLEIPPSLHHLTSVEMPTVAATGTG